MAIPATLSISNGRRTSDPVCLSSSRLSTQAILVELGTFWKYSAFIAVSVSLISGISNHSSYLPVTCKSRISDTRNSLRLDVDVIQMHGSARKSAIWIPPAAAVSRPLFCSPGRVDLEVCLEKTSVADGEPIVVNCSVSNQSSRCIKTMKVALSNYEKFPSL